jgi:hypothetical protein
MLDSKTCRYFSDSNGNIFYSTVPPECMDCALSTSSSNELSSDCGKPGRHRRGIKQDPVGKVFVCTSDTDLIASSKSFRARMDFYLEQVEDLSRFKSEISNKEVEKTNRLFHNLTSLNAHSIQELYSLIPQTELSAKFKNQKKELAGLIHSNAEQAAETFLKVLKNEVSVRNEFSVYRKLNDPQPTLNISGHKIHRVVLNVANLFFQNFADKGVTVEISDTEMKLALDYDSMQVALYHLMDNAAKYIEDNTKLRIHFETSPAPKIVMKMVSLFISEDELTKIFEPGFSGSQPRAAETAGKGVGMGLVRDLLALNKASIAVIPGSRNQPRSIMYPRRVSYANNTIEIVFSNDSILEKGQSLHATSASPRGSSFRDYKPW